MKQGTWSKLYSIQEFYVITYLAIRSIPQFRYARKHDLLSEQFAERIMLAVTEVNGCAICSYAHTKWALEAGLSNEEIQDMLAGVSSTAPPDELPAIMFAQHYADYRGHPSTESWERLTEIYGLPKSEGIVGAIRIMMMGNAFGIPWSSFFNRFKGKADERSNVAYELGMMLSTIVFIPVALVHALLALTYKHFLAGKSPIHDNPTTPRIRPLP